MRKLSQICSQPRARWLLVIIALGAILRLGAAFYLGNSVEPTPAAYDQIFFHDVALNLLEGRGYVFTTPPWPFIAPGTPTAYVSFLYGLFVAGIYRVFGPHPLALRIVQALICSLLPWQAYSLTRQTLKRSHAWEQRSHVIALIAAAITACYAYFVYYSATLMTEGLYLVTIAWTLLLTLDLAEQPSIQKWAKWGLAATLASLLRQVFMPMALLLFVYVLWRASRRVQFVGILAAAGIAAILILPWTVRNYLVFDRFLLLNSQSGQVLWNANHPDLGVHFQPDAMFPIPGDLERANEVELSNELMRRAFKNILADPWRFVRLSLNRTGIWFKFWPSADSHPMSNLSRTLSFGICLPFMLGGLIYSFREWRSRILFYGFSTVYTLIHVVSWVQIRYRMPVDLVLIPFAALAVATLAQHLASRRSSTNSQFGV